MSAIAGLCSRSNATIDGALLRRLSRGLETVGPDGEEIEIAHRVGMAVRRFDTDREARRARPVVGPRGCIAAFEGWLDERGDLVREFRHELGEDPTHTALALAVFERWGLDGLARLVGDFTLAIWDPQARRLFLAADPLGSRPLYVHVTAERVAWASRARALVAAGAVPLEVEPAFIAAFLVNSITPHSPYRHIQSIPAGHVLVVDERDVSLRRYWTFDTEARIDAGSDGEVEERFRELFAEAVACRMGAEGPVFAELSGGVDSSTIVCEADRLLRAGAVPTPDLHTVSYVFDQASSADERPYIRRIEEATDRATIELLEEDHPILSKRPPAGFRPDAPTNQISYLARYDAVSRLMRSSGSKVLLSGLGGDQAFLSEPPDVPFEIAERWLQRRPLDMVRAAYRWSRQSHAPFLQTLWHGGVTPLLGNGWTRRSRKLPIGEWFAADFLRDQRLRERGLGPGDDLGFRLPSAAFQYSMLRQTMRHFALQKCLSDGHFEVRYPYLDRRLLEFALALPLEQKLRPDETRSVVRRALRGRLPADVLDRRTKAGPTEAFQRALLRERAFIDEIFENPRLGRLGIIDAAAFRDALHGARHGVVSHPAQMHRTVSLELWLRSFEDEAPAAVDHPVRRDAAEPANTAAGA